MLCDCGETMVRHERMVDWEKQRYWQCPLCGVVKLIPRPDPDKPRKGSTRRREWQK